MEIVVVDDASTDKTSDVLTTFLELGAPIKLVSHVANRGVGAARSSGVANSSGSILMWLDSDDQWLPHAYDELLAAFEANDGNGVVQGQIHHRLEVGVDWPSWVPEAIRYSPSFIPQFGATAMSREVFAQHPISRELRTAEDLEWELRAQRSGVPFKRFNTPILIRWIGQDNLCHDQAQAQAQAHPILLKHAREMAKLR